MQTPFGAFAEEFAELSIREIKAIMVESSVAGNVAGTVAMLESRTDTI